jgi:hypothetical protein
MKTCVASVIFLLVGLVAGFYAGNRSYHKRIADDAVQQLVESGESSDRFEAAIAVRSVMLIQSGESSNAVQFLSRRIGDFYRSYAALTHNDERTKQLLALIEQVASTNTVVGDEIHRKLQ